MSLRPEAPGNLRDIRPEARVATGQSWSPPAQFEEYRLSQLVGRGRMGQVYLAYDTVLARNVAVKFVSAVVPSPAARERFLTEARAAARIQHPNVVSVYRVGEHDGRPYLISEFIRGQTLDKLQKPLAWQRVLEIGMELARGLAAAHRGGVLHRDLKPQNAIIAPDGHVKLLDFGLAKLDVENGEPLPRPTPARRTTIRDPNETIAPEDGEPQAARLQPGWAFAVEASPLGPAAEAAGPLATPPANTTDTLTVTGLIMGTPDYMSPEAWRGELATRSSDVYSLGAVLYELCAAHPPYGRARLRELADLVQARDARPLLDAAPTVDPRFATIIDRCLRRDPAARFANGDALREALEELSRIASAPGLPEGNPYRGLRPFEAEHRALFFGRADEVGIILDRLRSEPFLLLAGDSGVGKSSICRAGVLPLAPRALEGGRQWTTASMVPGRDPLRALAAALARAAGLPEDELSLARAREPERLVREVRLKLGETRGALIFADQLEELVTVSDTTSARLADEVLALLARGVPGLKLVATVRADLLTRVAELPAFGPELARALYLVRPLTPERVREVILGPARATGIHFESEALVDELVQATANAAGGLPLLQFALTELWEARDHERALITTAALSSIGGVAGALARHADTLLAALHPGQRDASRRMLMRLVTLDGTRARRTEGELTGAHPVARAALDALVRGRIVVAHESGGESVFEVAHEVLLQGWTTLRNWLVADQDQRLLVDRLGIAAAEWDRLGRAREGLWAGKQLAEAARLSLEELNPREAAFVQASRGAQNRARRRRYTVVLGAPLLVAGTLGAVEVASRHDVNQRIGAFTAEARGAADKARAQAMIVAELRQRALRSFDAGDREQGQGTWASAQAVATEVELGYAEAANSLEAALTLGPTRQELRALMADVLFDRALLLADGQSTRQMGELLKRLALYDDGGERRARWNAAAALTLNLKPPGTTVVIERVVAGVKSTLVSQRAGPAATTPLTSRLTPGAYIVAARAPGRTPVRAPVLLRRGEAFTVSFELPLATDVPADFVFVPPGRSLFGSSADEALQKGFFDTVPLHSVETGGYLIGRNEVTVAQWIEWLETLPPAERSRRTPATE